MSDLFLALFLLTLPVMILGLFRPGWVLPGTVRTRGRVGLVYGSALVAFFIAFGVNLPPKDVRQAAMPSSEPAASPEVAAPKANPSPAEALLARLNGTPYTTAELQPDGDRFRLIVAYRPTAIWSPSSYIEGLGVLLQDVGSWASRSGVPVESVTLHAFAPAKDRYGNADISPVFVLGLEKDDFGRINWSGVTQSQLLDLVSVRSTALGGSAVREYCSDKDHSGASPRFCRHTFGD